MDQHSFFKRVSERRIVRWALGYLAGAWILLEFTDFLAGDFDWPGYTAAVAMDDASPAPFRLAAMDPREARVALAVLPFVNLGGDPDDEYFSDGVTEDIIAAVSRIPDLRVISRTSVMTYKNTDRSVVQIGQELNVDLVLEGSVRRVGDRVRIVAQLIDARSDDHLWSETYDRDIRDILAIQAEVAQHIARELSSAVGAPVVLADAGGQSVDPEAYSLYLQGRQLARSEMPEDRQQAAALFEAAVELDTTLTVAYSALAESVVPEDPGDVAPPARQTSERVMRVVQRGLERAGGSPELHLSAAVHHALHQRDVAGAAESARKAIEANPNHAGARRWYAALLGRMGRHDEALEHLYIARSLDPLSAGVAAEIGEMLYAMGRHDEAIRELDAALARDPRQPGARATLGLAYQAKGETARAIEELRRAAEDPRGVHVLGSLGYVFAVSGQRQAARAVLDSLRLGLSGGGVPHVALAQIHAGLGEADQALQWLQRSADSTTAVMMAPHMARAFEGLRSDPRFQAALGLRPPAPPPIPSMPAPDADSARRRRN
jgi:TolB-like protein/Tfp pilus assembly protein PilF